LRRNSGIGGFAQQGRPAGNRYRKSGGTPTPPRLFADHGAERCPFGARLIQSVCENFSLDGASMKTLNADFTNWPDAAGSNSHRSVLGPDLIIEGDVTSTGSVDVEGKIVGSVRAPGVVIAGSGHVEGNVVAHDLSVLGTVSGMISARNVQLAPSAVVRADIAHARIAIEAGAEIDGRLRRKA
jgi:cytoskeletal protein CcmA (bactofilin family)